MKWHAVGAGLSFALLASAACAQGAEHFAARSELHPVASMTLSDQQFLTGQDGAPVTISGLLRVARGEGRRPTVILLHGSGGMGPNVAFWSNELNAMGISTFALDGFTGRGLTAVSTNQALLGRLNFVLDAYRGLGVLATHPRVDPERIVLMGFSRGGQGTLYASLERFHQSWNKSGIAFAGYVPFYPDCATTFQGDTEVAGRPIRIFHGTPDDYNPVASCRGYVERLRAAGRDVVLTEYPNAQHAFDNPLGSRTPTVATNAQTVRGCALREEPRGVLINAATRETFTYKDPCVATNPHVGHDPEATRQAAIAVKAFLTQVFKLD